jgi:hypothetical protein
MIKQLITATLFGLGCAGVGLVGYLATEPLAFTHPVRLGFTQRVRATPAIADDDRSPAVLAASVPGRLEAEPNSIWLAEVLITGALPKAGKRTIVPVAPVVPARFDPCSEWRDVGALVVDGAVANGVRNVRTLCTQPDIDR